MATAVKKQNLTVRLRTATIKQARVLAAQRSLSISGFVEEQIEALVGKEDAYERAKRRALELMEKGFPMGGKITASRNELHER